MHEIGYGLPLALTAGPYDTVVAGPHAGAAATAAGSFNLLAFLVSLFVTFLLVIGTSKSAKFTALLVIIKIVALAAFILLALPAVNSVNFDPMLPNSLGHPALGVGVLGASASIFFAYVGFDAVSPPPNKQKIPTVTCLSASPDH